ncbi:hypothetical protein GCM10010295_33390 [Streptomyces intermedius]
MPFRREGVTGEAGPAAEGGKDFAAGPLSWGAAAGAAGVGSVASSGSGFAAALGCRASSGKSAPRAGSGPRSGPDCHGSEGREVTLVRCALCGTGWRWEEPGRGR